MYFITLLLSARCAYIYIHTYIQADRHTFTLLTCNSGHAREPGVQQLVYPIYIESISIMYVNVSVFINWYYSCNFLLFFSYTLFRPNRLGKLVRPSVRRSVHSCVCSFFLTANSWGWGWGEKNDK